METLVQEKIVLQTPVLQEVIGKAVKACSFTESFPVTCMLQITAKDKVLTVTATDNVNIVTLRRNGVGEGEIDIVVDAKLFSALISRLTSAETTIVVENDNVIVKANGSYDIPLIVEQDGSRVSMPSYEFDSSVASNQITSLELRTILTMNKSCKAEMKEMPSLFNYYMDSERVLTTDFFKACNNPVKLFNRPVALPPTIVDLIPLVSDDAGVTVQESGDSVLFTSSNGSLYGKKATQEDLDSYPVQDLLESMNESYDYSCLMNRTQLSNALDRICLFTGDYDSNAVTMTFEDKLVTLTTKRCNTNEAIKYQNESNIQGCFSITVDAVFLKNQLNSSPKEEVQIKFGNPLGVQLVCDKIVQLACSVDEEEV